MSTFVTGTQGIYKGQVPLSLPQPTVFYIGLAGFTLLPAWQRVVFKTQNPQYHRKSMGPLWRELAGWGGAVSEAGGEDKRTAAWRGRGYPEASCSLSLKWRGLLVFHFLFSFSEI